jgi:hypothetical protein
MEGIGGRTRGSWGIESGGEIASEVTASLSRIECEVLEIWSLGGDVIE